MYECFYFNGYTRNQTNFVLKIHIPELHNWLCRFTAENFFLFLLFLGDNALDLLIIPNFYYKNTLGSLIATKYVKICVTTLIFLIINSILFNYDMDISLNIVIFFISTQVFKFILYDYIPAIYNIFDFLRCYYIILC